MRIVSSDGCLDVPYEWVNLVVDNDDRSLIAIDYNENLHTMGKYNSRERVFDIMKEIRNAYVMDRKVYAMPEK